MKNKLTLCWMPVGFFLLMFIWTNVAAQTFRYPVSSRQTVTDTIFGKLIKDDYRWLEEVNNQQVQTWLKAQSQLTASWLEKIPARNALIEEYKKLDALTTAELSPNIVREGGRYFYKKTMAGENMAKLYYQQGNNGKEILLFDPASVVKGNATNISFDFLASKDGQKVALAIHEDGKLDISTVKVINVETKQFYSDSLYPVFSLEAWSPDNKGFIYGSLQTDDQLSTSLFQDMQVKYHLLGEDTKQDRTILSRITHPDMNIKPADLLFVKYSADDMYLMATLWSGSQDENRMIFATAAELQNKSITWSPLIEATDQVREAHIYQDKLYVVTREEAPNFKVLVSLVNKLNIHGAQVLIPESTRTIESLKISKDFLFVIKSDGISTAIDQYNFSTHQIMSVKSPISGYAWLTTLDRHTNDCMLSINSWKQPRTRYEYEGSSGQIAISRFNLMPNYPGVENLVVEEVEVKSHDGVMVPLSLIYNKSIKKDGKNVVYMTGYGAYGAYGIPFFNKLYLPLLNNNVIIAITHVRGGGEKGHAWHMGGFKATKPNTWKDFIACGEYLVKQKYTSAKHLIGEGFSAGGIMIGRAITERPDLFAATIHNVPVSNVLRGENRPNGMMDAKEFGTVKDSVEAMGLIEMDAYLHVKKATSYPAVLATTATNDSRVPVWQPAKFIAALQNANISKKPIFLQVYNNAGHIADEKSRQYRNMADMFCFALWQAGHPDYQVKIK